MLATAAGTVGGTISPTCGPRPHSRASTRPRTKARMKASPNVRLAPALSASTVSAQDAQSAVNKRAEATATLPEGARAHVAAGTFSLDRSHPETTPPVRCSWRTDSSNHDINLFAHDPNPENRGKACPLHEKSGGQARGTWRGPCISLCPQRLGAKSVTTVGLGLDHSGCCGRVCLRDRRVERARTGRHRGARIAPGTVDFPAAGARPIGAVWSVHRRQSSGAHPCAFVLPHVRGSGVAAREAGRRAGYLGPGRRPIDFGWWAVDHALGHVPPLPA